jgi:TRAP-type mannitol/chloroaromatic compound transport system permease small subunit
MGLNSLGMRETWQGTARLPLYPLKLLIPAVAFLFLLQAIISLFRNDK